MSIFDSFVRKHDYLVCVDSDGCVMDTMNCKHFNCFGPCMVDEWELHEWRDAILDRCNLETMVQHTYDRWCMMRRNRYMVDHASHIIALYDGVPKGGTAQTLAYAMKKGLTTDIIPPE